MSTTLNIGATGASDREIDTSELAECARGTELAPHQWDSIQRMARDAAEWARERSTSADATIDLERRADALADACGDAEETARVAGEIWSARMHPTARSIVGGAAAQAIYSLTGRRAHKWEGR